VSDPFIDRHEAKIKSITMEAPEGYEFGHIVKAEVEMRVGTYSVTADKEGNIIRTATLVVESCHIKENFDPSKAFSQVQHTSAGVVDTDDDDDEPVTTAAGESVDVDTGEIERSEELVGSFSGGVDNELGF
jgi:hypothetical protein